MKGAPTVTSAPASLAHRVAHTYGLIRQPAAMLRRLSATYGDPFVLPTLEEPFVMVAAPALVAQIFAAEPDVMDPPSGIVEPLLGVDSVVLARGPRHRRKRKVLSPSLQGARMKAYGDLIVDAARRAFAEVKPGDRVELLAHTQRLSLDVIIGAIFGTRDAERLTRIEQVVSDVIDGLPAWLLFSPWLQRPLGGRGPWDRYQRRVEALFALLREAIADARRATEPREDILSLLLAARDEDGAAIPEQELIDELRTLVIAGHETTANTLARALHELHRHPAALARLREELAPLGPNPTPAQLASLPWLEAVCDEALRLHPIVPVMARRLARDFTLGGHALAAGTMVCPAVMLTHLDPALHPEPFAFRPERFLQKRPPPGTFYPYGGGSRRCLGAALADYELRVALGAILSERRFEPSFDAHVPSVMRGITVRPARALRLTVAR